MTVPTFEDIMLPLITYLSDNQERNYPDVINFLKIILN